MKIKKEELTKKLLEMECLKGKTIDDLNKDGCIIGVYDVKEFIRKVIKSKSHNVKGHAVVYGLCNISFKESDYVGVDITSLDIQGNIINLSEVDEIKVFISHSHWYDIFFYNKNGYVTLCFSPKN